jgi:hypothetical protein
MRQLACWAFLEKTMTNIDDEEIPDTMSEVERLNPQFRWDWRKTKSVIKWRAKQLIPNVSYALGCRGHPGLVITRNYDPDWSHWQLYGADVEIRSLVDGVEESCSIFHCAPQAISKAEAFRRKEQIETIHTFDISVSEGYSIEEVQEWAREWYERGVRYYVLSEQNGVTVRSGPAYTEQDAIEQVAKLSKEWFVNNGITNPRMVDLWTYPVPPQVVKLADFEQEII